MNFLWGRYLRVSSEDQALPGTASLDKQDEDTAALIRREGGVLVDTYRDDHRYYVGKHKVEPGGGRTDRPEWLRLLGDMKSGRVNAVAAWHSSRLYRNYRPAIDFLELCETLGLRVALCTESFDPRWAMLQAWRDREENKARVERSSMGRAGAAKNGFHPSRRSLFYRTLRNENGKRTGYVFVEEYRPFFDRLAALFLAHVSYEEMARALGPNPATGKPLIANGVRQIVGNSFYRGLLDFGKRATRADTPRFRANGNQPAAWDAPTCAAIEHELIRRAGLGRSVPHLGQGGGLFSGILRCGYCRAVLSTYHQGTSNLSYACSQGYKGRATHPGNHLSEREAEALVEELFAALSAADTDAWLPLFSAPRPATVDERELSRLRDALAETQTEFEQLSPKSVRARAALSADLERQRADYDRKQALYEAERADTRADPASVRLSLATAHQALDPRLTVAERRGILLANLPALYIKAKVLVPPPAV